MGVAELLAELQRRGVTLNPECLLLRASPSGALLERLHGNDEMTAYAILAR